MIDLNGAQGVQVQISKEGVLWVNVDGICQLRSQDHKNLEVADGRDLTRQKVKPEHLEPKILDAVIQQIGYKEDGKIDKEKYLIAIRDMSVYEALDRYLIWHGIIGYTTDILEVLKSCLSSSTTVSSDETSNSEVGEPRSTTETAT